MVASRCAALGASRHQLAVDGLECTQAVGLARHVRLLLRRPVLPALRVVELPEEQFDAVTAISGSGPAFLAYFAQLMIEGGATLGVSHEDAVQLVGQTMLGTARLLGEKAIDPADLIASVASAKGTTVAGLKVLEKSDLSRVLARTIRAAARRSKELSAT